MMMDGREELKNAEDSILRNNESDSIKTEEMDSQLRKEEEPIISAVTECKWYHRVQNIKLESNDQNSGRSNHQQPNVRFLLQSKS
jgi:hypothetical protein